MKWKAILCALLLALGGANSARAAGTTPLALAFQFDETGQRPLVGCLLYFYLAGTVATPQQVFQDFALSQPAQNPMSCSSGGRVPQHWLADGLVHLRLTDASGVVQLDTTMQVLGPSGGGGGGGGGGIDPNAVAQTGDIKFRLSLETLNGLGWVILNGTTIGNDTSGASQRHGSDTQNLFVYLWQNCPNAHCPVLGGRGTTALADFNGSKQITLPDMRGRTPVGLDCMNVTPCAGRLLPSNIASGGGDGVDTPGAFGGVANYAITKSNLPSLATTDLPVSVGGANHSHGYTDPGHTHTYSFPGQAGTTYQSGGGFNASVATSSNNTIGITISNSGSLSMGGSASFSSTNTPMSLMQPFMLGSWFMKL